MSEILRDENGQIIKPEVKTAPEVPMDRDFIADLQSAVTYKIDKKTRESREFLKALENESAQKVVENVNENVKNVSHETHENPVKEIIGLGILILVGFCGYRIYKNVKKSQ